MTIRMLNRGAHIVPTGLRTLNSGRIQVAGAAFIRSWGAMPAGSWSTFSIMTPLDMVGVLVSVIIKKHTQMGWMGGVVSTKWGRGV